MHGCCFSPREIDSSNISFQVQGAEIKPTEAIEEEEERGRKTSRFNGKDNDDHRLLR